MKRTSSGTDPIVFRIEIQFFKKKNTENKEKKVKKLHPSFQRFNVSSFNQKKKKKTETFHMNQHGQPADPME